MQFSKIVLLSLAAVGVIAAPTQTAPTKDVAGAVVSAINTYQPKLQQDYSAINALKSSNSESAAKTAFTNLNNDLKPLVSKLQKLAAEVKSNKNSKRATNLELAVTRLVTELNTELPRIFPIVEHLTTDLGLSSVTALVQALEPTLYGLVAAVEALLLSLAPGLSGLVDPLLTGVVTLLASLGLNLDGDLIAQLGLDR